MNKILKFIARIGAVGGTARFVANGYNFFQKQGLGRNEIFKNIIKIRFKILKNSSEESEMIQKSENIENLTDLTFLILQIEGVIPKDTPIFQNMDYILIVREELRKKNISEEVIGVIS